METKSSLQNILIIISEISSEREFSLNQASKDLGINRFEIIQDHQKISARDTLLKSIKEFIINADAEKIQQKDFAEFETNYDLIIKVGAANKSLEDSIITGAAYAEIYFANIPAEDFDVAELKKAIEDFEQRKRNFGS